MFRLSLIFCLAAIVAAIMGFGAMSGTMAGIAQVLFVLFIGLFVSTLVAGSRISNTL
jgi:uncharacterized membrane protein YtjA (UPF0391 family)